MIEINEMNQKFTTCISTYKKTIYIFTSLKSNSGGDRLMKVVYSSISPENLIGSLEENLSTLPRRGE